MICNHHNHSHVIDIHMMSMHRSILNQTTDGNVIQAFKEYSLDPKSRFANTMKIFFPESHLWKFRYKTIPKKFDQEKIYQYYDSDNPEEVNISDIYTIIIKIILTILMVRLISWKSASRRRSFSTTRSTRAFSRRSKLISSLPLLNHLHHLHHSHWGFSDSFKFLV